MGNINNFVSGSLNCSHYITENPDPLFFNMHAHDVCELFVFLGGEAHYYVEGNIYPLKENDIMIMRQGETHKMQISPDCIYDRMTVHFSPNIIYESHLSEILTPFYNRPLGRMNLYRKEDFETDFYLACLEKLRICIDKKRDDQYIIAPLIALLEEIFEAFEKRENSEYESEKGNLAVDMVDYINRHIFDDINLQKIAAHFFISSSQANRVFKKSVGSPIWEYVIIKRLMAAKDMIAKGMSASSAAEKCGFADYSSFYRAYRKRYGMNPKNDSD